MPASAPLLLIVTGAPGTGKTTLARRIAQEFRLPLIAKDAIKESLFDSLGWKDRAWSQQLGRATIRLLFYFVETQLAAERSCIVESNFRTELATPEFRALQARHDFVPLQVVLKCERDVLAQRFRARSNSDARHPGHVDRLSSEEDLAEILSRDYGALDIGGQVIEIDTTDFGKIDYAELFRAIELAMNSPSLFDIEIRGSP
ncbi:MAG: ATP-binding protein [Anaerolineales bacterium]|nr:ATP-binding protein [Anaerolineales bacterium]